MYRRIFSEQDTKDTKGDPIRFLCVLRVHSGRSSSRKSYVFSQNRLTTNAATALRHHPCSARYRLTAVDCCSMVPRLGKLFTSRAKQLFFEQSPHAGLVFDSRDGRARRRV